MQSESHLIWLDLEMTGLDVDDCTILEIATIVTDAHLEIIALGPDLVVHHEKPVLDAMDVWNTEHHGQSGLTQEVLDSSLSISQAEGLTLEFLQSYCIAGQSPLCGNSIGNDRNFIQKYMPQLFSFIHYRNVDVSSVKELVRRWYGEDAVPEKSGKHRALDDIHESINELKFYRERFFRDLKGD